MSDNPYSALNLPSLEAPAPQVFLVAPSDTLGLPRVVKRLRIYNPGAAGATVTFHPVKNGPGNNVTLTLPAGLSYEDVICDAVLDTGSDNALIIHGYTD